MRARASTPTILAPERVGRPAATRESGAGDRSTTTRPSGPALSDIRVVRGGEVSGPRPVAQLYKGRGGLVRADEARRRNREQQQARREAVRDRLRAKVERRAAVKIQAQVRGFLQRNQTRKEVERDRAGGPFTSSFRYHAGVGNYSPAQMDKIRGVTRANQNLRPGDEGYIPAISEDATRRAEWGTYDSTGTRRWHNSGPAIFHSLRQSDALATTLRQRGMPSEDWLRRVGLEKGNLYEPNVYGNEDGHDMRSNSAWLLGLAHNRRKIVMSTPLTDDNVVRGSAPGRDTADKLSALGREVVGITQTDRGAGERAPYEVEGADRHGRQVFRPTADAGSATLAGMKTAQGMPKNELIEKLSSARVDVHGLTREADDE